jgi:molybdenum cofactor sulfurtransferase
VTDVVISDTEASFHREHPGYADTAVLDDLRATDFARLDHDGHVYLDYTGGGMFPSSQVAQHMALLESGVFGNPHSINPTSAASSELVERALAPTCSSSSEHRRESMRRSSLQTRRGR